MSVIYSGAVDLLKGSRGSLDTLLNRAGIQEGEFLIGVIDPSADGDHEIMVINLRTMRSKIYALNEGWEELFARDLGAGHFLPE
jgi:hypothetical protein